MPQIIIKSICLIAITSLFGCGSGGSESPVVIPVLAEDALNDDDTIVDNNTANELSSSSDSTDQNSDNEPTHTGQAQTPGATACGDLQIDTDCIDQQQDSDGDGKTDLEETDTTDTDGDGVADYLDSGVLDEDADGVLDELDNANADPCIPNDSSASCQALNSNNEVIPDTATGDTTTSGTATDAENTDSDTSTGDSLYAVGSLASIVLEQGNLAKAFAAFKAAGLDLAIDDPKNSWTVFLPTDEAIAADPSFDIQRHIYTSGAIQANGLYLQTDQRLKMNNGDSFFITGGGAQALKIADSTIVTEDLVCTTSTTVVHVIDKVLNDFMVLKYPEGSLADILQNNENLSRVMKGLRADGFDRFLNDPDRQWTWFLPSDTAAAAVESFPDVDLMGHVYTTSVLNSEALNGLSGVSLNLRSGDLIELGGGGTETLTIGEASIVASDIQGNTSTTTVHIIDKDISLQIAAHGQALNRGSY